MLDKKKLRNAEHQSSSDRVSPSRGARRILSIWFPRLAIERALLEARLPLDRAAAVFAQIKNAHVVASLSRAPTEKMRGLYVGQSLRDALMICPSLLTFPHDAVGDALFLSGLRRFADRYSPWVADDGHSGLTVDVTGCAHLFGGEESLIEQVEGDYKAQGLSSRTGLADTPGAAWALARFSEQGGTRYRYTGDDIDQEARATRWRSTKRWRSERKTVPKRQVGFVERISPPGGSQSSLLPLPVAALQLDKKTTDEMSRLGIRTVGQLLKLPRVDIEYRFDAQIIDRIDQALGFRFEPISPARHVPRFAVRLSLPEPVGLKSDILAGLDRLLPELCRHLKAGMHVARRVRFELQRVDGKHEKVQVELARATDEPARIRALLAMKLDTIVASDGIDVLRLTATLTEPVTTRVPCTHLLQPVAEDNQRFERSGDDHLRLEDLISRLGARIGLESVTRFHPAESHIPEKSATVMAAVWSAPALQWIPPINPRPAFLFSPEIIDAPPQRTPPKKFYWHHHMETISATGPERIIPEWWFDDPNWRSGKRDYWRVETACGRRLWLFYAYGDRKNMSSKGWFCHGDFG